MNTSDAARSGIYLSSSRSDRVNLEPLLPAPPAVDVVDNDSVKRLAEDQLIGQRPHQCVTIIAGLEPLSRRVLGQYPDVNVIARLGTDMDSVNLVFGSETLTIMHADPDRDNGRPVESARTYDIDPSWDSEIAAFAEAIDAGAAPDHGTSQDAFLTMSLLNSIYYADEQWRSRHSIPNPKTYSL